MDLLVGGTTGVLKGVNVSNGSFQNLNSVGGLVPKETGISVLCWRNQSSSTAGGEDEALAAQLNRDLKLIDTRTNTYSTLFNCHGGEGSIRGLHVTDTSEIVTGVESGLVKVWDGTSKEEKTSWSVGNHLSKLRGSPTKPHVVATGGKETPLKLWDLNSPEKPTFIAKNVKHDWLQLRVPIWVNDIRFLKDSEQVVTCTGYHQIRVYDPKTGQRRPVREIEWAEQPFGSMDITNNPHQVIAGNNHGGMALFDLRGKGKMVQVYKGSAGAIRSVESHPDLPYVASCGVDRFVRVHHVGTRELIQKIYCKVPLNALLMRKNISLSPVIDEDEDGYGSGAENDVESNPSDRSDDSADEVWGDMESVVEKMKRKKDRKRKHQLKNKKIQNQKESKSDGSSSDSDSAYQNGKTKIKKITPSRKRKLNIEKDSERNETLLTSPDVKDNSQTIQTGKQTETVTEKNKQYTENEKERYPTKQKSGTKKRKSNLRSNDSIENGSSEIKRRKNDKLKSISITTATSTAA